MRTIFTLGLRAVARSIDRSTGSPISRWSATALAIGLPALLVAAGRSSSTPARPSAAADVANLLIVAATFGALVVVSLVLAWRPDPRMLELFQVSPLPSARWQFALLAPCLLASGWVSLATAAPLVDDVATNPALGVGSKSLVVAAAGAVSAGTIALGLLAALGLRLGVNRLPAGWRSTARSGALVGSTALGAWGALRFWTFVNRSIVEHQLASPAVAPSEAFDIELVAASSLVAGLAVTAVAFRASLAVGFAAIEHRHATPLAGLRLAVGASPARLGLSWLRNGQSAAHLAVCALTLVIGLAAPGARWLTHAALLLAAAGLVGFAPGNVAMRSIVRVGARDLLGWFMYNALGALWYWGGLTTLWSVLALAIGEPIFETVAAGTLIMALALVVGGLFAYSYRTSFGAELANLATYCLGAMLVVGLVDRGWFRRRPVEIVAATAAVATVAVAAYAVQSVTDRSSARV
ncbi:MAG: hypothetical protein ACRBI6_19680 [Acidimicrobiales bacterium]